MQLLNLSEAGEILGVRPEHVRRLTKYHGLPSVRVGKLVRIEAADLQAWIESNRKGVL